ncbi:hypothetical protein IFM89_035098 [Coptis chinensis]|uniref:Bulb-type lectin domain-containing protein n=1 Tax=Coptis chinensis TaxID=261450 RepID=A0A835MB15_9MAGN|nr:hypothetical protein IFM89_035098 [Coptis chinensis]
MFFFSSIQTHLCFAADTISSGQSLIPNQTLISSGGKYELGFFTPGTSLKYYIGIWYKNILPQTIVWVANRDTPLTDSTSSELKLLEDGNLVLFNQLKRVIWSTNMASFAMSTAEAELGDDGNLVLRRQSNVFWQSFDHPTDTFLPGAKIRYDNITKKAVSLTSWRNSNDPARGLFTLEMDPNENQYVISWNQNRGSGNHHGLKRHKIGFCFGLSQDKYVMFIDFVVHLVYAMGKAYPTESIDESIAIQDNMPPFS